ncbi:hypothetical protein DXK93_30655 [Achromobacter sp. K91]|nr:hypothetical protein DXK93_30655 [Achromobacter sp. K91]
MRAGCRYHNRGLPTSYPLTTIREIFMEAAVQPAITIHSTSYDLSGYVSVQWTWNQAQPPSCVGFSLSISGMDYTGSSGRGFKVLDPQAISCDVPYLFSAGGEYQVIVLGLTNTGPNANWSSGYQPITNPIVAEDSWTVAQFRMLAA